MHNPTDPHGHSGTGLRSMVAPLALALVHLAGGVGTGQSAIGCVQARAPFNLYA